MLSIPPDPHTCNILEIVLEDCVFVDAIHYTKGGVILSRGGLHRLIKIIVSQDILI